MLVASRATLRNVGWGKDELKHFAETQPANSLIATVVGQATGHTVNKKSKYSTEDRPAIEFNGDFIIKNVVTGEMVRARKLFLPYDAQCVVEAMMRISNVANVAFGITVRANPESLIGYVYGAKSLTKANAEDPIMALLRAVEAGEEIPAIAVTKDGEEVPVQESKKKAK